MSGQTPGQALCEAVLLAMDTEDGLTMADWGILGDAERADWEAVAIRIAARLPQAAIAAAAPAAQPAPDLEDAFASGVRVRTTPCPVETHDGDHLQIRTNSHWLCGHLLASLLTVHGDIPVQPAPELAAALAESRLLLTLLQALRQAATEVADDLQAGRPGAVHKLRQAVRRADPDQAGSVSETVQTTGERL